MTGFAMPAPGRELSPAREPDPGQAAPEDRAPAEDEDPLADDELVDLGAWQKRLALSGALEQLDAELVGIEPVKTRVREIAALLLVDRLRARYGLTASRSTLHMCFTGSPGTGKTTVAQRTAEIHRGQGYQRHGHQVSATRDDQVGE